MHAATTFITPPNNLGLVGYWSFNDGTSTTATDFSGNGNTGTLVNGPTWTSGKLGQSLNFVGASNTYVNVPYASSLNTPNAVSLSAWVQTTQSTRADIVTRYQWSSPYNGYGLVINPDRLACFRR